jgi:hypothetical protein
MERHWSESWKDQAKDAFNRETTQQAEQKVTEGRTASGPQETMGSDMIRAHGNRPYPKPSWAPRVNNALYFQALSAERAKEREKIRSWRNETRAGRAWEPGGSAVSSRDVGRAFTDAAQGRDGMPSGDRSQSNSFNRAAARDGWRDTYAQQKTRAREIGGGRSR